MAGRRRRTGAASHQSIAVSPLDMLEEEMHGFTAALGVLQHYAQMIGTENDGLELRNKIIETKQGLSMAESSISNRIKSEFPEEEAEKHGNLEEEFFEMKTNYFSLLRYCNEVENQVPISNLYSNNSGGPDIQRFGNPHTSPALQMMQQGPPVIRRAPPPPAGYNPAYEQQQDDGQFIDGSFSQGQQFQLHAQDIDVNGIQLQQRDSVFWDAKELVERHQEMELISSEVVHLREVYQDFAVESTTQAEQVEVAQEQVVQAQENTKQGVKTLGRAAKAGKKVILPGVGGGIGGVTGAVAGSVIGTFAGGLTIPGAVVGAAVGATAGATVGHAAGIILRKNTDKTMHKARLSENWQPDSSTKVCSGCQVKFTQINRRHHCRNCGMVFCNKCTKHKMHIPGVSSESRPRVCKRCFEALMYHNQGIAPPSWRDLPQPGGPDGSNQDPNIAPNDQYPPPDPNQYPPSDPNQYQYPPSQPPLLSS